LRRIGPDRPLSAKKYQSAVGLRPDKHRNGNVVWLKRSAFRELFSYDHEGAAERFVNAKIVLPL
jgi:hypothetical protein